MSQSGNRRHLRGLVRTFAVCTQLTLKAAPQVPTIGRPPPQQKQNSVGEGSPLPPAKQKIQAKQSLRRCRASSLYWGSLFVFVRTLRVTALFFRKGGFHIRPLARNFILINGGSTTPPCGQKNKQRANRPSRYHTSLGKNPAPCTNARGGNF